MTRIILDPATPYLEGAPNFRDLGGYAAASGGSVRHGRVFRSEVLSRLTDSDMAKLAALDIRLVFDLRQPTERKREQNRWPAGQPVETMCFDERPELADAQAIRWLELLAAGHVDAKAAREMMLDVYRRIPKALAPDIALLFERLDAPEPPAMLVHCTGGKDRSGFVCAMLLWALGASMETIVADYLVTGQRRPPERFVKERLSGFDDAASLRKLEMLRVMAGVDIDYLATAFDQIHQEFASVDHYLETACGLDTKRKARLRASLIADSISQQPLHEYS